MNIDLWQAVLAVAIAGALVGLGSRWWFVRRLDAMERQREKLDANHQSTLRTLSQTRKQIDDLQRLVIEYRRKLTALELERRRASASLMAMQAHGQDAAAGLPAISVPGGWADTQPL